MDSGTHPAPSHPRSSTIRAEVACNNSRLAVSAGSPPSTSPTAQEKCDTADLLRACLPQAVPLACISLASSAADNGTPGVVPTHARFDEDLFDETSFETHSLQATREMHRMPYRRQIKSLMKRLACLTGTPADANHETTLECVLQLLRPLLADRRKTAHRKRPVSQRGTPGYSISRIHTPSCVATRTVNCK